jgi:hypothetical protein
MMDRQERLDELRRRLYRPDATEEDHRRYAAAAGPAVASASRPRRQVLPALLVVGVLVVACVVAVVASRVAPALEKAPVAAPAVTTTAPSTNFDIVARGTVGLPESVPVDADGVAVTAQRFRGDGAAAVPLEVASAPKHTGRVVLVLSSADPGTISWRAVGLTGHAPAASSPELAHSAAKDRRGVPSSEWFAYTSGPPHWITVKAAAGASWTLTVAFLPKETANLR